MHRWSFEMWLWVGILCGSGGILYGCGETGHSGGADTSQIADSDSDTAGDGDTDSHGNTDSNSKTDSSSNSETGRDTDSASDGSGDTRGDTNTGTERSSDSSADTEVGDSGLYDTDTCCETDVEVNYDNPFDMGREDCSWEVSVFIPLEPDMMNRCTCDSGASGVVNVDAYIDIPCWCDNDVDNLQWYRDILSNVWQGEVTIPFDTEKNGMVMLQFLSNGNYRIGRQDMAVCGFYYGVPRGIDQQPYEIEGLRADNTAYGKVKLNFVDGTSDWATIDNLFIDRAGEYLLTFDLLYKTNPPIHYALHGVDSVCK